jgi:hypothetical protein
MATRLLLLSDTHIPGFASALPLGLRRIGRMQDGPPPAPSRYRKKAEPPPCVGRSHPAGFLPCDRARNGEAGLNLAVKASGPRDA